MKLGASVKYLLIYIFLAPVASAATVGVQFDYDQEALIIECWNHLFDDEPGFENYWFPGPWSNGDGTFETASCNGLRETLPGEGFRLQVEASADAAHHGPILGVQQGSVETRISYEAPYTLHRVVELRRTGNKQYLAFPVVEWRVVVDGSAEVEVDGNTNPPEHAYIRSMGVQENGIEQASWENPSTGNNNEWTVYDDGRRLPSFQFVLNHDAWIAPQLSVGDAINLDVFVCPPAGSPELPPWLADQCSTEGQQILLEHFPTWESVLVRAQMGAHSGSWHLPFDPILSLVDGGEALACFGLDSPMDSFDISCSSEGIKTSVEVEVTGWVQYRVRQVAANEFRLIEDTDGPQTIPTLAHWALAALMLSLGCMGAMRLRGRDRKENAVPPG
jgi:hypothetical protein